jgi:hypothetical protein
LVYAEGCTFSEKVACGAFSDISFVFGGCAPRAKSVVFAALRAA